MEHRSGWVPWFETHAQDRTLQRPRGGLQLMKMSEEHRKGFEELLTEHRNLDWRQRVGWNSRRSARTCRTVE